MEIYLENPTGRQTKAYQVVINDVSLFFSYETCIAMVYAGRGFRVPNTWGPTTGKHFKEMGLHNFAVVSSEELEQRIADALYAVARDETSDTKSLAYK